MNWAKEQQLQFIFDFIEYFDVEEMFNSMATEKISVAIFKFVRGLSYLRCHTNISQWDWCIFLLYLLSPIDMGGGKMSWKT